MKRAALACVFALMPLTAAAEPTWRVASDQGRCRDGSHTTDGPHACEVRELVLGPVAALSIDGTDNGGVSVAGQDRKDLTLRAIVGAGAPSEAEARAIVAQVRLTTIASGIRAEGPRVRGRAHWWASYEASVPRKIDLTLRAMNGGIEIADVDGRISFDTTNGGASLERLAGNVRGRTMNGGLDIVLAGQEWRGEGLDVETTNGGVEMAIPSGYNARIESGTVNGGVDIDFPVEVSGKITRNLAVKLGRGGATVRATTTNGGVSIRRTR